MKGLLQLGLATMQRAKFPVVRFRMSWFSSKEMILEVVAAVIERPDRRLLIGQRRAHDTSPLKWEFPGGKVEAGESPEQALARELREELGVTLRRAAPIGTIEYAYPNRSPLRISFFAAEVEPGELRPRAFQQIAWALPRELADYDFLAANHRLVAELATGRIKPAELLAACADDVRLS
jgi:8-oxo-dGTP diphosphatase